MPRPGLLAALAVLAAPVALSACATKPQVSSEVTRGANLAAYQTFSFVNATPPAGMNPVTFERIRQDVASALTAKGYTKAAGQGDLSVIITLGARERTDINTWGAFGRQIDVNQYTEGKMAVDVFSTQTQQPLWHGQATQTIDPNRPDPTVVDTAVAEVMARFPPRA